MKKNDHNPKNKVQYMPIGMCIGLSLGIAIGSALDNIGVGMCLGLGIGLCFGSALDAANRKKADAQSETDDTEDEQFENKS